MAWLVRVLLLAGVTAVFGDWTAVHVSHSIPHDLTVASMTELLSQTCIAGTLAGSHTIGSSLLLAPAEGNGYLACFDHSSGAPLWAKTVDWGLLEVKSSTLQVVRALPSQDAIVGIGTARFSSGAALFAIVFSATGALKTHWVSGYHHKLASAPREAVADAAVIQTPDGDQIFITGSFLGSLTFDEHKCPPGHATETAAYLISLLVESDATKPISLKLHTTRKLGCEPEVLGQAIAGDGDGALYWAGASLGSLTEDDVDSGQAWSVFLAKLSEPGDTTADLDWVVVHADGALSPKGEHGYAADVAISQDGSICLAWMNWNKQLYPAVGCYASDSGTASFTPKLSGPSVTLRGLEASATENDLYLLGTYSGSLSQLPVLPTGVSGCFLATLSLANEQIAYVPVSHRANSSVYDAALHVRDNEPPSLAAVFWEDFDDTLNGKPDRFRVAALVLEHYAPDPSSAPTTTPPVTSDAPTTPPVTSDTPTPPVTSDAPTTPPSDTTTSPPVSSTVAPTTPAPPATTIAPTSTRPVTTAPPSASPTPTSVAEDAKNSVSTSSIVTFVVFLVRLLASL